MNEPPEGMRRTKVLMLVDRLQEGGAERLVVALATNLPRERYEVAVCMTRRRSTGQWSIVERRLLAKLAEAGVRHFSLGRRHTVQVTAFRKLAGVLRREQVDVLHAHMFGSNFWGTLFGRLAGTPVIVAHEHTWSYQGRPLRKLLDGRFIGRLASAFTCGSSADRRRMIDLEGVPEEKAIVIPNAYFPRPDMDGDLRAELGFGPETPLVGTVAQLRPQKALGVLVDAFALSLEKVPDARLVIGGDGQCRPALERRARELGVAESVHFIGQREDVSVVLRALDVAAMSSDFEATSLFALECMAHETPLVSTGVGGLLDMLEDGRQALLVPPRDPPAMARALEELLMDPARRRELAVAAQERLRDFTLDRFVSRYDELYQRLLRERGAPGWAGRG